MANVCETRMRKCEDELLDDLPHEPDDSRIGYRLELVLNLGVEPALRCKHCGSLYVED